MSQPLWRKLWVRKLSSRLGLPSGVRKRPIRVRGEWLGAGGPEQLEDRTVPATTYIWTGGSSTNWSDPLNWNAGVGFPQNPGDVAQFTTLSLGAQTVNIDVPVSV